MKKDAASKSDASITNDSGHLNVNVVDVSNSSSACETPSGAFSPSASGVSYTSNSHQFSVSAPLNNSASLKAVVPTTETASKFAGQELERGNLTSDHKDQRGRTRSIGAKLNTLLNRLTHQHKSNPDLLAEAEEGQSKQN